MTTLRQHLSLRGVGKLGIFVCVLVLASLALKTAAVSFSNQIYLPLIMKSARIYLPLIQKDISPWQVVSPDEQVVFTLAYTTMPAPYPARSRLYYNVAHSGVTIIEDAPLGMLMQGQDGNFTDDLQFIEAYRTSIDETYTVTTGKRATVVNQAHELVLRFRNNAQREMDLVIRAYNDGVAFRYRFPGTDSYAITSELSGFRLPAGTVAWAQRWQNNYEQEYYYHTLDALDASDGEGDWGHPILLALPGDRWALLTEASVYGDYAALHFRGSGGNRILHMVLPPDQTEPIEGILPLETPWRVVIAGDNLATLIESDLITNLNPPSQLADTSWIKPGRVAWSWWANTRSPQSLDIQKQYVDFASEMGWEYVLVDEGWDADWMPELVRYARERNVDIILWSYARLFDEQAARQWVEWGIKGAKLDFIDSDNQVALRDIYDPLYALTAQYKLMLNFHGATKPSGTHRQWPHHLTREAVQGAEYRDLDSNENINLVFTRNIIGSMDYTPVVLSRPKGQWTTTYAAQLAQAILFESGWQHFPDTPDTYRASPGKALLAAVPTTWDDTRFIDGYPDQLVILARRKGTEWYIAANGVAAGSIEIPLRFLAAGQTYRASIYRDGISDNDIAIETRMVTAEDILSIGLREHGGCAIHLIPLD